MKRIEDRCRYATFFNKTREALRFLSILSCESTYPKCRKSKAMKQVGLSILNSDLRMGCECENVAVSFSYRVGMVSVLKRQGNQTIGFVRHK